MTRGLLQELGPKHSREGAGREIPCPLSFCSGLPPAKPSQKQRARKPGGVQLPRAQSGSGGQMENNQHTCYLGR